MKMPSEHPKFNPAPAKKVEDDEDYIDVPDEDDAPRGKQPMSMQEMASKMRELAACMDKMGGKHG